MLKQFILFTILADVFVVPWGLASTQRPGAVLLALALACTSVFRGKLARSLRIGAFLEGPLTILRSVQSGHPGDYVLWLTVGLAIFGSASLFLLR